MLYTVIFLSQTDVTGVSFSTCCDVGYEFAVFAWLLQTVCGRINPNMQRQTCGNAMDLICLLFVILCFWVFQLSFHGNICCCYMLAHYRSAKGKLQPNFGQIAQTLTSVKLILHIYFSVLFDCFQDLKGFQVFYLMFLRMLWSYVKITLATQMAGKSLFSNRNGESTYCDSILRWTQLVSHLNGGPRKRPGSNTNVWLKKQDWTSVCWQSVCSSSLMLEPCSFITNKLFDFRVCSFLLISAFAMLHQYCVAQMLFLTARLSSLLRICCPAIMFGCPFE